MRIASRDYLCRCGESIEVFSDNTGPYNSFVIIVSHKGEYIGRYSVTSYDTAVLHAHYILSSINLFFRRLEGKWVKCVWGWDRPATCEEELTADAGE